MVLGDMAEVVLGSQRVQPLAAVGSGFVFRFATLRDALEDCLGAQAAP
jgi:NAD dependent epimerase/dehydratase family enzyme